MSFICCYFIFFKETSTTQIYTLSLHDALPIFRDFIGIRVNRAKKSGMVNITSSVNSRERSGINTTGYIDHAAFRSEERFSRNAETDLVCRLLLEKKKKRRHFRPRYQRHPHVQY